MGIKSPISLLKTALLSVLIWGGCHKNADTDAHPVQLPQHLFRDGDIVFRKGTGITSRVVLTADREGTYSHTGILRRKNGRWFVIHAVPGEPDFKDDPDRVKMETIESFFEHKKAVNGAIMRIPEDSAAAHRATMNAERLYEARILFDHDYNLTDTTKMYCTELIDFVYRKEGIDLPEGRISQLNIPGFRGEYLLPNDIAQSKQLLMIHSY